MLKSKSNSGGILAFMALFLLVAFVSACLNLSNKCPAAAGTWTQDVSCADVSVNVSTEADKSNAEVKL